MIRTLITGASGFTGRYLSELLSSAGHEVHGLSHDVPEIAVAGLTALHIADLSNFSAVERVVAEIVPHKVVHLAGVAFVAHDDVSDLYRSNVVGTRQLLESLSRLSTVPSSVAIASSANIYGNRRPGLLSETAGPAPANDYGVSKVAVECLAQLYSDRLPVIVARPFNYTGRGQSSNFVIPKIVENVRQGEASIELGNLDVSRDFSDVRTVVDAYARLLDEPSAVGGVFNICSGEAVSLREVIQLVQNISGRSFEVNVNPAFVRSNEVHSLWGSPALLEATIGPLHRIALQETLSWMLSD